MIDNSTIAKNLIHAESVALELFEEAQNRGLIRAGISEQELNRELLDLAAELLGVKKFWHKRIVRAGRNTLFPYRINPPDLIIKEDDILFFDFGPVLEQWEADIGRTYVIGNDSLKIKLRNDTVSAWIEGRNFILKNPHLTGSEVFGFMKNLAANYQWEFGGEHCGHLIGLFPHEKLQGEIVDNYLHPENHKRISDLDSKGNSRFWILEIHFVDREREIGGFYEGFIGGLGVF